MNPDTSFTSITSRVKQHKRRREDPTKSASFNVSHLVPERPLPGWIKHRVKRMASGNTSATFPLHHSSQGGELRKLDPSSAIDGTMMFDLNNRRKDWKSISTRRIEAIQRARISQNRRPEPIRSFPGDVRPVSIPSDSPVALFAQSNDTGKTRKNFGLPTTYEVTNAVLDVHDCTANCKQKARPMLMEKTFLSLDQSKLPLEVSLRCCFASPDDCPPRRCLESCSQRIDKIANYVPCRYGATRLRCCSLRH